MSRNVLYTYRCPNCYTVAITDVAPIAGRPERCKCSSWLRLLYTTPITDAQRELVKRGLVFNPYQEPAQPVLCVRCEGPVSLMTGRLRPDGRVCGDCYAAEAHPPFVPLTPAEVDAKLEADRKAAKDYDDNHQF